ncbi:MAG: hypothetical protein CMC48_08845 [Flavobacteriaceae bacterium]|nr:hypothetical protein [Flavobacteriaceae bacterium]|tara:strand:- start:690 stop:2153 length:1464 start_codon:yes stop_codon:yes gene_type:complete
MILSIWRYCHFSLAAVASLFLILASLTGAILAFEPITNSLKNYSINNLNEISLKETLSVLDKKFKEVYEIQITAEKFVSAKVLTSTNQTEEVYLNPINGETLEKVKPKSKFFSFFTNLHRSLFFKKIGRVFVGLISFILSLITLTGLMLLIQRQGGVLKIFKRIKENDFSEKYHVVFSRIFVVPVFLIAISGAYLTFDRFVIGDLQNSMSIKEEILSDNKYLKFDLISLDKVKKVIYPFSKSESDFYAIELNDRSVMVNQYNNRIYSQSFYPFSYFTKEWFYNLHTGKGNLFLSIILLVSSISILFFIFTGFKISIKSTLKSLNIKYLSSEKDSKYIILVGSEKGNTFEFAKFLSAQIQSFGERVIIKPLNSYKIYNQAETFIILTSTYGEGDPPSNANNFVPLFKKFSQHNKINYSIIGFGSLKYPKFCAFAVNVDSMIKPLDNFDEIVPLMKINRRSVLEFNKWIKMWNNSAITSVKFKPMEIET